jgi:hypothetical protein
MQRGRNLFIHTVTRYWKSDIAHILVRIGWRRAVRPGPFSSLDFPLSKLFTLQHMAMMTKLTRPILRERCTIGFQYCPNWLNTKQHTHSCAPRRLLQNTPIKRAFPHYLLARPCHIFHFLRVDCTEKRLRTGESIKVGKQICYCSMEISSL